MTNIRTALNRGAFDFITKPIDFQDLAITLEKSLREVTARKQAEADRERLVAIRKELDIARRIQESIVPRRFPAFPGRTEFALHASMRPARAVGGDFYDFFLVDEHHLAFTVGDVTGKGVPAALFMAVSRTLLRATGTRGVTPDECLRFVNDVLCAEAVPGMFVTCFYGVLDTRTGVVEFSNGGHNPPVIVRKDGAVETTPLVGGFFLGAFGATAYERTTLQLGPGDTLVVFTDGISEAADAAGEQFGEERLAEAVKALAGLPADEVVQRVGEMVDAFAGDAPQADDMTLLALTWAP